MAGLSDDDRATTAVVITAERVPLALPLAGLGERAIALLVDFIIVLLLVIAVLFVYTFIGRGDLQRDVSAATTTALIFAVVTILVGLVMYDVTGDLLFDGRTPGKKLARLRVIDAHGRPPDAVTSLLRNLLRLVDMLPAGYGVGVITMFITGTKRLGDLVAGTMVISERGRGAEARLIALVTRAAGGAVAEGASLSDDDVLKVISALRRAEGLEPKLADQQCARLAKSLAARLGEAGAAGPRARLAAAVLSLKDAGGMATRLARIDDAEQTLSATLVRYMAAQGSGRIDAAIALDAAARHASSELLAASRRGVPPRLLESLSLSLLDMERRRRPPPQPLWPRVVTFFGRDVPGAVWRERQGVLRAAVVLFGSGAIGFGLAFVDAGLARALIGDALTDLVEQGARWTNDIEKNGSYLSASLQIVFNNVGVGVRVFALGILGGVATVLGLVSNGVSLGATFGTAFRLDNHETLARFIVAHGPVELSMICVAGAAGFCLGRAVLAPGPRTRVQALREEGRTGLCLVAFATVGFVTIGFVEGFVSPGIHFPLVVNATVGVSMWLLFFGWARLGRTASESR